MAADRVQKALGERFSFTLTNSSGARKIVALLAAFLPTLLLTADGEGSPNLISYNDPSEVVKAGYACDAVLDDGVILGTAQAGITATATNSKMNIRQFVNYIKSQPRILIDLTIQASNVAAFNEVIEVAKLSPLVGAGSQYLPLSEFLSVDQQSSTKINIYGVNISMMYDTLMLLPVQDGHSLTISMRFS